jgi:hypothetical protein
MEKPITIRYARADSPRAGRCIGSRIITSDDQRKIVELEELLNLVRRNHHITTESLD